MRNLGVLTVGCLILTLGGSSLYADYQKGEVMLQIYGGGAGLSGRYHQPGVSRDEQDYADGGGLIGGQFLYYVNDSPCWALGVDVSHASFGTHDSSQLLTNRFTQSSADNTTGLVVARLAYPKGRWRPYLQGGVGAHHTSLTLDGTPLGATTWSDTGTTETRTLLDEGHIGPAFEGAIGIHVYLTPKFFIGAEYKVLDLVGKDFEPTPAGQREGLLKPRGTTTESGIGFMLGFGF